LSHQPSPPEDPKDEVEVGLNEVDDSQFCDQWSAWDLLDHDVDNVEPAVQDYAVLYSKASHVKDGIEQFHANGLDRLAVLVLGLVEVAVGEQRSVVAQVAARWEC
jgi:hypothetical protein